MRDDDDRPSPSVLGALWQYRLLASIIVVVVFAGSTVYGFLTRGDTVATAKMVLVTPNSDDVIGVSAPTEPTFVRYVAQRALFVTSKQVLDAAAEDLDGISTDELRDSVTAVADSDGSAILVSASANTAKRAASISNRVVAAYESQTREQVDDAADSARRAINQSAQRIVQQLGTAAAAVNSSYQALSQQASSITIAAAKFGSGVTFVDPATADAAEAPGLPIVDMAVGLLVGLLVAATASWLLADARAREIGIFRVAATDGPDDPLSGEAGTPEPPVYEPPVYDAPIYDVPEAQEITMEYSGSLLRSEAEASTWTEPEAYGDIAEGAQTDDVVTDEAAAHAAADADADADASESVPAKKATKKAAPRSTASSSRRNGRRARR